MDDLIDRSQQEKREKRDKRKRERDLSDIKKLAEMPEFRRFEYRVLSMCGNYQDAYVSGDPHATSYSCGRKSIGLWVMGEFMIAKPELIIQMQREHNSEMRSVQNEEE